MWWLNNEEEKIIGPFYDLVLKNQDKQFIFELNDGAVLKVKFDTESESDNDLEPEDDGYEEYREAYFEIVEVIADDSNIYSKGRLIAINYHCVPITYKIA